MAKSKTKLLDKTELKKLMNSIIGVKYNMITSGDEKGLVELTFVSNPKGVEMAIWTKEQSADLDKRFGDVNKRLDVVEQRLDRVEQRLDRVEQRLDRVEQRLDRIEVNVDLILKSIQSINQKLEIK